MKKLIILLCTFLVVQASHAQLTKKYWLVGGSGSFKSFEQTTTFTWQDSNTDASVTTSNNDIVASAKIGYFVIDKLALGITPKFTINKSRPISGVNASGGYSDGSSFSVGPFIRYYFLNEEKPYNILAEANYQFGILNNGSAISNKGKLNGLTFLCGPEFFFNTSTGIEILFGYEFLSNKMDSKFAPSYNNNGFQMSVGLQLHLEKR